MKTSTAYTPVRQRGMALVAALLLLVVITILGVTMFRSYGLTERVAGNTREKERALAAALSAQAYAEFYLNGNKGANSVETADCSAMTTNVPALMTATMVCTNALTGNVAQVPWAHSWAYTPPGMTIATGSAGTFTQAPQFYITYLGAPGGGSCYNGNTGTNICTFQIDAAGWGGSANTVAVVESAYEVTTVYLPTAPSTSGSTAGQGLRSYNLANP